METTRDHLLALLTAHPDTWELTDVPDWLAQQCLELRLIIKTEKAVWKLTEAGYRQKFNALNAG